MPPKSKPGSLHQPQGGSVALFPGNLLPYKEQWQAVANRLPKNAVLIIVPADNPTQKQSLLAVAQFLARAGHQVRVLSAVEVMQNVAQTKPDRVGGEQT